MSTKLEFLFYKAQAKADRVFLRFIEDHLEACHNTCGWSFGDDHWILLSVLRKSGVPARRTVPLLHRFLSRTSSQVVRDAIWGAIEVWDYYSPHRYHKIMQQVDLIDELFPLNSRNFAVIYDGGDAFGGRDFLHNASSVG